VEILVQLSVHEENMGMNVFYYDVIEEHWVIPPKARFIGWVVKTLRYVASPHM
jgi:hypothetical protein